jgi:hypothetical protein
LDQGRSLCRSRRARASPRPSRRPDESIAADSRQEARRFATNRRYNDQRRALSDPRAAYTTVGATRAVWNHQPQEQIDSVRDGRYARRDSETGRPYDRSDPRPRPACDRIGSRSSCPRYVSSQRRVIRQADGGGLASADVLHHGLLPERPIARPGSLPKASERRSRLLDVEGRDEDNAWTPFNCRFVRLRRIATDVVCD